MSQPPEIGSPEFLKLPKVARHYLIWKYNNARGNAHKRQRYRRRVRAEPTHYDKPDCLYLEGLGVWSQDPLTDIFALSEGHGEYRRSTVIWTRGWAAQAKMTVLWQGHFMQNIVAYDFLETPEPSLCPLSLGFLGKDTVHASPSWLAWRPTQIQAHLLSELEVNRSEHGWGKPGARIRCFLRLIQRGPEVTEDELSGQG